MAQKGWQSYFIVGEQNSWNVIDESPRSKIYEFISTTLRGASDPITPTRIHRNPSPVQNLPGTLNASGDIAMHMHAEDMLIWFKHLFMDAAVSSADFTAQEVYGNGAGAGKAYGASQSLDTQPAATTTASDPGQLVVTFAGTSNTGTLTITGTDQNGTVISEALTITGDGTFTTDYYFQTVDASGIVLTGTLTGGTMLIMCDKNTYTHTIELGDTITDGLTIELVKGGIPNTYVGCLINSGVIDLADTITFTMSLLAKQAHFRERVNLDGTGTPTSVAGYSVMGVDVGGDTARRMNEIYPGWGMAVQLDTVQTEIETSSLSMSNNLDYPNRYSSVRTMAKPVRQGDRDILLTCSVDYDTVANGAVDFDDVYYSDDTIATVLTGVRKPYAGPEYTFTISMPKCQLTAHPDPEISSAASITQELALRPIRSTNATSSDELSIEIVSVESGI